jgi:hypothetical protein
MRLVWFSFYRVCRAKIVSGSIGCPRMLLLRRSNQFSATFVPHLTFQLSNWNQLQKVILKFSGKWIPPLIAPGVGRKKWRLPLREVLLRPFLQNLVCTLLRCGVGYVFRNRLGPLWRACFGTEYFLLSKGSLLYRSCFVKITFLFLFY